MLLFRKRTLYSLGLISGLFTIIGSAILLASDYIGALFTISSVFAAAMMFFIAPGFTKTSYKLLSLLSAIFVIIAMFGGSPQNLSGAISAILGAIAWPLFALLHKEKSIDAMQNNINTMANLVILAGALQLLFTFIALPDTMIIVLAMIIGVIQAVFAMILRNLQPKKTNKKI